MGFIKPFEMVIANSEEMGGDWSHGDKKLYGNCSKSFTTKYFKGEP